MLTLQLLHRSELGNIDISMVTCAVIRRLNASIQHPRRYAESHRVDSTFSISRDRTRTECIIVTLATLDTKFLESG